MNTRPNFDVARSPGAIVDFHAHALAGAAVVGMSLEATHVDHFEIQLATQTQNGSARLKWTHTATAADDRGAIAAAAHPAAARLHLAETGQLTEHERLCDHMDTRTRDSITAAGAPLTEEEWERIAATADLEVNWLWTQIHSVAAVVRGRPGTWISGEEITDITGIPNPRHPRD